MQPQTHPSKTEGAPGGTVDIGALFDAHAAYLCRVAHRLTGSRAVAEDVVQEVFVTAWKRRDSLQPGTNIRTWLYQVTVNHVRHHRRAGARLGAFLGRYRFWDPAPAFEAPDAPVERVARAERVHACVAQLTPKQREVFVLYELEELEGAEIAKILDIPVNTVWSRLRLARARFKDVWCASEGGTP